MKSGKVPGAMKPGSGGGKTPPRIPKNPQGDMKAKSGKPSGGMKGGKKGY